MSALNQHVGLNHNATVGGSDDVSVLTCAEEDIACYRQSTVNRSEDAELTKSTTVI